MTCFSLQQKRETEQNKITANSVFQQRLRVLLRLVSWMGRTHLLLYTQWVLHELVAQPLVVGAGALLLLLSNLRSHHRPPLLVQSVFRV